MMDHISDISIVYEIYYLLKHNHDISIQVKTELQKYQCFLKRVFFVLDKAISAYYKIVHIPLSSGL